MTDVQSVDHVQLPIPMGAAPKARAFYEGLLGLKEVRSPELDRPGTLRFSLGWQRLDLSEGTYTGVAPQAHLALRVRGIPELTQRLLAAGFRVDLSWHSDHWVYTEDPFGNRLELIELETASIGTREHLHVQDLHLAV